ncbi:CIC11C00000005914 [Sungouiella intermedia]|uniref:CIC11C00000005914 n=1 Tax=Sungouiella intermedia TaxID=45354 RepID=A0A1L0BJ65_9ASCO|nr:CIC11C00000005914 [[Candida] intermedia]
MADLFFLRHGPRADFAATNDPPIYPDYRVYDPLVTISTVGMMNDVAKQILLLVDLEKSPKKTIYIHYSPYLRCCQTADILTTALQNAIAKVSGLKVKIQLLGDFALSEWIHDKMKNKPPFSDSTEAYQMYTPNVRLLQNKKLCLNFRPTTQLGPWNEPDLLFKDFQARCRHYFEKLLATYDKPSHQNDMVIVVSHGYVVSTLLSYFVNHPIFEEIPEASLNYAHREDGVWILKKDSLGILEKEGLDGVLNLETEIVYYKTNFIKKDAFDETQQYPAIGFGGLKPVPENDPRPSFKVQLQDQKPLTLNPLCPGAKDWDPRRLKSFRVKSEFAIKVMNDEAFKRAFDLSNPPTHPVSPEVSPGSEPTRSNSTIDLVKLRLNEEIFHPFKLRYSLASDIPVQYLNSKVNSHASLTLLQRNANSHNNSSLDLLRSTLFGSQSFGPGTISGGLGSPRDEGSDQETANMNDVIQRLARVRSLQRRRAQSTTPKFGIIPESEERKLAIQKEEEEKRPEKKKEEKKFTLHFGNESANDSSLSGSIPSKSPPQNSHSSEHGIRRRRSSSVKFIPSVLQDNRTKLTQSIFYNLESGSSSSDEEHEESVETEQKYRWFGQNI